MARRDIKYSILELDGIELDMPTEHIPDGNDIKFDVLGWIADNVRDAIIEAKNSGFSFSKRFVRTHVIIPDTDEMIVSDCVEIAPTGSLEINGLLTILGV